MNAGFNPLNIFAWLIVLAMGWAVVVSLRRGEVRFRQRSGPPLVASRKTNPIGFWFTICVFAFVGLYVLWISITEL